jgi:AraC-like DNA-binding protein
MVTIQEIHAYLEQLTPQDELYKQFYLRNGRLLRIDELEGFLKKNRLSEPLFSPLSFLDPAYHGNSDVSIKTLSESAFSAQKYNLKNAFFFDSYEGISIRKHSNYFPSFCHNHIFLEACIVKKGQCSHQLFPNFRQKEQSDTITMHKNDLLIIPPGIHHTVASITDSVILNILVKKSTIEKTIAQFLSDDVPLFNYFTKIIYENKIDSFLLFRLGNDAFLDNLLDQLLLEYCNRPPLYQQIMSQILGLYFSIIQRDHGNEIKVSNIAPAGTYYMPKFLLYLQSHYADFSMAKMENHFGLSASYISRIFKANTENTIMGTVLAIRLETAKNLLKSTSLLIDDIAEHIGYEDTTYFIRIFKNKFALTPLQYRKNFLAQSPQNKFPGLS